MTVLDSSLRPPVADDPLSLALAPASPAVVSGPAAPQVRLGLAWAAVTTVTTIAGPGWLALWLAPLAAVAAGSVLRRVPGGRGGPRLRPGAGMAAAGAIVLASAAGSAAMAEAACAAAAALGIWLVAGRRSAALGGRTVAAVLLPALAGSGLVVARARSETVGIVLLALVCGYDAVAYLMGTGARRAWAGPAAGVVWIVAVSLFAPAVAAPPFDGATPWVLAVVAAVVTPLGPVVGRALAPAGAGPVAALRRLDSLLLLGPAWALAAATVLRR